VVTFEELERNGKQSSGARRQLLLLLKLMDRREVFQNRLGEADEEKNRCNKVHTIYTTRISNGITYAYEVPIRYFWKLLSNAKCISEI